MAQNTNLNIAPYFDDFDQSKGFLKVLFKPGYPVQARELTTLQSVLQNQIDTFGTGVYKEGSMVVPGGITLNTDVPCVIIQNTYLNLDVELYRAALDNQIIKGSTSGVRARILFSISATTSTRSQITFYVNYLEKASDNTTSTFTDGETFTCESDITYASTTIASGTPIAQLLNSNSNSRGSTASVGAGTYYVRGYFVPVAEQTLLLDQYGTTPSYKVGLKVEERIITADEDATLYDNAIGSTNFSAPGADRFKINLTLVKKDPSAPNAADFIELLRTNTGRVQKKVERSTLGFINDVLATRTKEESGDYYVKKFSVDARENLDDGFNNGVFGSDVSTSDGNTPSEENIAVQLSSGSAYISGYRTERLSTSYKDVDKPRTFDTVTNQSLTSDFGNYVFTTNQHQAPTLYETIELRDTVTGTPGTASGTVIGLARALNFYHESGAFNNQETVYRTYLSDVQIFTKITLSGNGTWTNGRRVYGLTSGATGFVRSGSSTVGYLYQTNGNFIVGEELKVNDATGGGVGTGGASRTISAVTNYNFSDVKSYAFGTGGTADAVMDVRVALPGSGPIISGESGSGTSQTATVTATLSNFNTQLKVGDLVEFSNNGIAHKVTVTGVTSGSVFTVQKATAGAGNMANGAINGSIVRSRPEIKEATKKKLLTPLGFEALKNTNNNNTQNPAGYFRVAITGISVSSGNATVDVGSGLLIKNADAIDDFVVSVTSGSGDGDILREGDFTTGSPSVNTQSVALSGLLGGGSGTIDVIVTVYSSNRSAKAKTTERMKILKIDKTIVSGSPNGLTTSTVGYGHRIDDDRISLGCGDVFAIKGIFESTSQFDPILPQFKYKNLLGSLNVDDIITGDVSGSRARIISTTSDDLYFIPVDDDVFTDGETLTTSAGATLQIVQFTYKKGSTNITDNYDLDDGMRDQYYDFSSIVRKPGYTKPTHIVYVIFDRFLTTSGVNPYTVDSYATSEYKIIPKFDDDELRDVIDFRPIVGQELTGGGNVASPWELDFSNTSGKFFDFDNRSFAGNLTGLPGIGDTTILSLQHYLGRVDKVYMNKDNVIQVVKGAPATNPAPPDDIDDAMLLATMTYKPYVFDVDNDITIEETNFKRFTFRDIQVLENRIKTLEYYTQLSLLEGETASMEIRDASGLSRYKNGFIVDNFASLATADTLHPDFRVSVDFEEGQMRPAHYTTQVPLTYGTGSTNVQQTDEIITLPYSSTVLIDQPYASAVENVNPFNVFTYVGDIELYPENDNWVDTKSLNPIKGPTVEGNFLTTVREYNADQNGFSPIHWNSWKTTWTGTSTTRDVGSWRRQNKRRRDRTITTTTTTTTKQTRTGIRYRVTPVIEQQSLGSKVVSVEHIQFMRSRNIEFVCQKLKPRTKFYAFFDGIALPKKLITPKIMGLVKDPASDTKTNSIPFQIGETVHVTKGNGKFRFKGRVAAPNEGFQINPLDGSDITSINDYKSNLTFINIDTKSLADQAKGTYYGSPKINDYIVGETSGAIAKVNNKDLVTDKKGKLRGSFFIDAPNVKGNQKFKTGTKLFRLSDTADNSKVVGVSDSNGEAEFTSSGLLQTTQETIISVRNAKVTSEDMKDARTLTSSSVSKETETRWADPLAQTFLVEDSVLEGGVYLTKVDLFFFTKDAEIPVALDIRTVENGTPTQDILPLSKVVKDPDDVFISADASKPTTFTFKAPVFLPFRKEHALVLTSDSNQYKVFISLLGKDAIDAAHAGEKISEQPYIGVLFKSQNASTWTPTQYEDLMFKIYRAEFTIPSTAANSTLVLENAQLGEANGGYLNLRSNAIQTTSTALPNQATDEIRIFHSNHGMQSNLNYVELSGVVSEVADTAINMVNGFSATDLTLTVDDASQFHGNTASPNIGGSAISSTNLGFLKILGAAEDGSQDEIIAYEGISGNVITINAAGRNYSGTSGSGTGLSHDNDAVVQCYNLAGIPLTLINTTHNSSTGGLISINSPHSYNLKITGKNAGKSINCGGPNMVVSQNVPWDVLTPQIQSQVEPMTSIIARVKGTSGTSCGPYPAGESAETSFTKDAAWQDITIAEENYFPDTKIIANQLNEINRMNSAKSFTMEITLGTEVSHLSPVIDLTQCAVITTANQYNNITPTSGIGGECAANYITKVARLEKSASGIKVMLAANTFNQSKIVVMYKLVPVGYAGNLDDLPFQFFNTTGRPDSGELVPQNDLTTFTDYEYSVEDTDDFDAFQIKISLLSWRQPYIPRVKDFRAIALA